MDNEQQLRDRIQAAIFRGMPRDGARRQATRLRRSTSGRWLAAVVAGLLMLLAFLMHGARLQSTLSPLAQLPARQQTLVRQDEALMHAAHVKVSGIRRGILTLTGVFPYNWLTGSSVRIGLSRPHRILLSGRTYGHPFSIWLTNQSGRLRLSSSNFHWNLAGAATTDNTLWFESPLDTTPILWKVPVTGGVPSGFLLPPFGHQLWAPASVYPLSRTLVLYQTLGTLFGGHLSISRNNGMSWRPLPLPQPGLLAQIAGYQAGVLYVETVSKAKGSSGRPGPARLWRLTMSSMGSATWTRLPVSAPSGSGMVLALNPIHSQDLAVLTLQGMVLNNAVGGAVTPVGLAVSQKSGTSWLRACLPTSATMATGSRSGILVGNFDQYSLVSWAGACTGTLTLPTGLTPQTTPDALVGGNGVLFLQSGPKVWQMTGSGWTRLPAPPHGASSGLIPGNMTSPLINLGPAGAWALTPAGWSPISVHLTGS